MPYSHEKFPVLFARNVRHEERGHAFANSASGARECFRRAGRLRCALQVGLGNGVVLIPCASLCPLVGEYRDVAVAVAVEILDASPITRMVQVFGYVTLRLTDVTNPATLLPASWRGSRTRHAYRS